MSKLRLEQVIHIKKLIANGHSTKKIADQFGIPRTTVNSIKIGRSWRQADAMLATRENKT